MAKKSAIAKNNRRKRTVEKYADRRAELVRAIKHPDTDDDERHQAYLALRKMPRDASPVRYRNRCALTGRSRGNYRRFGVCRVALRELALLGELPGVRKASW